MDYINAFIVLLRVIVSAVFAVAGIAKLADLPGSRKSMADFGVPKILAGFFGLAVPVVELIAAAALIPGTHGAGTARRWLSRCCWSLSRAFPSTSHSAASPIATASGRSTRRPSAGKHWRAITRWPGGRSFHPVARTRLPAAGNRLVGRHRGPGGAEPVGSDLPAAAERPPDAAHRNSRIKARHRSPGPASPRTAAGLAGARFHARRRDPEKPARRK